MPVLVGLAFVVGLVLLLDCVRLAGGVVAYDLHIQKSCFGVVFEACRGGQVLSACGPIESARVAWPRTVVNS